MTTQTKVKWSIEADYVQGCSCDYGCPCEFEAPPTQGFCEGAGAWRITQGSYGNVRLNGLGLGCMVRFPQAMHLGNGALALYVDERANPQQRDALVKIASGEAGGLPFEVFPALITKIHGPFFVPFQFDLKGKDSSVKVGKDLTLSLEPIKNPVTGQAESIRIEHETGFIFKRADVVSAKQCQSTLADLAFSWPNKAGFVTQIKYGN